MSRRGSSGVSRLAPWSMVLVVLASITSCAYFGQPAIRQVERAGVRAWVIGPGEHPTQGPFAGARTGDFALNDGNIILVVSRGGRLMDVGRVADEGYDYLGQLAPVYDTQLEAAYTIESVDIAESDAQSPPAIVARGRDRQRPQLEVTTRYEIDPSSGAIVLTTHLRNGTSQTIASMALGDRIWWGTDNIFVPFTRPGNLRRPTGAATTATWICSWQDDFSLGVTAAQGATQVQFGRQDALLVYRDAQLQPGGEVTYRRHFPVRDRRIDATSEFAWRLRNETVGWLEGSVLEPTSGETVAGCRVEIVSSPKTPGSPGTFPLTWTYTNDKGRFRVALPPGRYYAWTRKAVGRIGHAMGLSYDVEAGRVAETKPLQVSREVMLDYEVRDADANKPLPCKLIFIPFPGTQESDFGPEWRGPNARDVHYSAAGKGSLNISPGRYRVWVSRGLEYQPAHQDVKVSYPRSRLEVSLKRVIGNGGYKGTLGRDDYISVDMGVRTAASPDCRVSARDRVVAAAAEGVQCLVSGDVGTVTDLAPAIEQAGLSEWVSAIPGRRVEWEQSGRRAEFLVFPCPPGPVKPRQLRREAKARTVEELLRGLRRSYPGSLVSICRPMESGLSYLAVQGFNPEKLEIPQIDKEALDFDLYEVLWGGIESIRATRVSRPIYARLLREFGRYGLAAGSDSHYLVGNECGYPRVYVARSAGAGDSVFDQIRDGLLQGQVLVTNGPFIRLLVNGQPPGSVVTDKDGKLDILLEVRAASWVNVRAGTVYDGEFFTFQRQVPAMTKLLRVPSSESASPEFVLPRGIDWSGPYKHDVIITATAVGQIPLGYVDLGPLVALDEWRGFLVHPIAMTGPVFVDVDGDGKCTPPPPKGPPTRMEGF